MDWSIDQYRNRGYDVHVYDEADWFAPAGAVPYQEIVSAVNDRDVTQVALVGYSHGGGSVYRISEYLSQSNEIQKPYTIPLTGYIDAIAQPATLPLRSRPLGSLFHINQFQLNTRTLHGVRGNGDDELDRTNLGVSHGTIDDSEIVLDILEQRLQQRVDP